MANNPYVNKVVFGSATLVDLTGTTATADKILQGYGAFGADGAWMNGTATGGSGSGGNVWQDAQGYVHLDDEGTTPITVEQLSVTQNGTYTAPTGKAYSPVTVNVSGGGGGESANKKQINFIDYDGTIVDSYTASEWASVTSLPSNPSHTGLTAQGWNWTKAQIDAQLTALPDGDIWVGQMYITTSGDTEIDVRFADSARLSPYLSCAVNGSITIDWGDNSTSTLTGKSLATRVSTQHTYASAGDYTITIHADSGSFAFYCLNDHTLLNTNSSTVNANLVYANCVQNVRMGANASIGNYAFHYCYSLASITIPDSVTSIGIYAFRYCDSLVSITIPDSVTSIGTNAFQYCDSLVSITIPDGVTSIGTSMVASCYSLASITIPDSVTSIGVCAFQYCYSLASITIPDGVTSIGNGAFQSCSSLVSITIPDSVTSIGTSIVSSCHSLVSITIPDGVTSIGTSMVASCSSLASITIPDSVTSIANYAFQNCYGMAEYHFMPTTPPTLANTNAFANIQSDCIIYVPAESLEAYQTATNWSTYASYMQGE